MLKKKTLYFAICDDEKKDLALIQNLIEKNVPEDVNVQILSFQTGKQMLKALMAQRVHAIFLDMDMPDLSGLEIARQIEKRYGNTFILFVTNRDDLVFESIRFRPIWYVRKKLLGEELKKAIPFLIEKILEQEETIRLQTKSAVKVVPYRDIIYLESRGHYLDVITTTERLQLRGKVGEYENLLNAHGFLRIHKGFILNIQFIAQMMSDRVRLMGGEELPVSRKNHDQIMEKYMEQVRGMYHES